MHRKGIDYDWLSKTGRRPTNEDRALYEVKGSSTVSENHVILAVADGMGGLEAGEVASKTVHDQLIKMFRDGLPGDLRQASGRIDICIKLCSRSIYDWSQQKKGTQVGTTVSGAVIIGNRCLVFNVGDSRTYVINAGGIKQLSIDHSADREAYEAGIIKKEEIGKGHYSNALTRAIGTEPDVKVDIFTYELKKGDIIFSCTDGLWGKVTDEDIRRLILGKSSMEKSLDALYKLAYKNESKDNISMAAYRYGGMADRRELEIKKDIKKLPAAHSLAEKIPEQKELNKKKKKDKKLIYLIILLVALLTVIIYQIIDLTREPVRKQDIKPPPVIELMPQGGVIESEVIGSSTTLPVRVKLSSTPFTFTNGDPIPADIYYTLDGLEPTKEKGIKYTDSVPIEIITSGKHILMARVFAREGKHEGPLYSREFDIHGKGEFTGGVITFLKPGGIYRNAVEIALSYELLKDPDGKQIPAEVRFTIDGDEPTAANGTLYKRGRPIVLAEVGNHTVKARVISIDGNRMGIVYHETYSIQKDVAVIGGKVTFSRPGGQYTEAIEVLVAFESLRYSNGEPIDSDLYYSTGPGAPVKVDGQRYSSVKLEFNKEGTYPIKARVISKDGKYRGSEYTQVYTIIKPGIGTVYQFDRLSKDTQKDISSKTEKIVIEVDGVSEVRKVQEDENVKILLSLSPDGAGSAETITGIFVKPPEKLADIKLALDKKITELKFFPPTDPGGKSVQVKMWMGFSDVNKKENKISFNREILRW
jgi:protein phosphatase